MKARYRILTAAALVTLLASCEEMDLTPEGETLTESQKSEVYGNDASKSFSAVSGAYMKMSAYCPNYDDLGAYRHIDIGYPTIMLYTDASGEDMVAEDNGYQWCGFQVEFTDRLASAYITRIMWNDLYSYIYSANSLIALIDEADESATFKFNLAQGLALRAFSYFQLAQIYQFNIIGNEDKPCVPIITDKNMADATLNGAPRAKVSEVYEQIYSDLDKAIELLTTAKEAKVSRKDKRYVDLATVYGLRARVNLVSRKWADAAADATKAIEEAAASGIAPASIADVSKPTFSSANENDWMWGIIVAETDEVVNSGIVNWISHIGTLNYGYGNYSGAFRISEKLFATIDTTDVRRGWWLDADGNSANLSDAMQDAFAEYTEGPNISEYYAPFTSVKFGPYNDVVATDKNANDIPLMRVEEMYLIKAEGEAMSGGNGLATLNDFVKTYRDPAYSFTGSDVQAEVWRQRRIELWGEGMSWFDRMRYNAGIDRRNCGYESSFVYVIDGNDAKLLWPIPEKEINSNPALSTADQNPSGDTPSPVADGEATIAEETINL